MKRTIARMLSLISGFSIRGYKFRIKKSAGIYCLLILSGCTSCKKTSIPHEPAHVTPAQICLSDYSDTAVLRAQARLNDIPLPINATPIPFYVADPDDESCVVVHYHVPQDADTIAIFYAHAMEELGWLLQSHAGTTMRQLYFEKPYKRCFIVIRTLQEDHDQIELSIIVTTRTIRADEE